jgi:hypothetical protein
VVEEASKLPTIKTSQPDWLEVALNCYKEKQRFLLVDDRAIGIKEGDLSSAVKLIQKARKSEGLSAKQIATILTSLGLSSVGVWLILIAIADPEPTSKLGILLAGGVALIALGGLSILRSLGMTWRVTAHSKLATFTVEPK